MTNKVKLNVVTDKETFLEVFHIEEKDYPFNYNANLKILKKDKSDTQYIRDELAALYKKNPTFQGIDKITSNDLETCGVYKVRIRKENSNKGKRSGYRVITLLLTPDPTAFVLDITDHSIQDDLTDAQKSFCTKITEDIEKTYKESE